MATLLIKSGFEASIFIIVFEFEFNVFKTHTFPIQGQGMLLCFARSSIPRDIYTVGSTPRTISGRIIPEGWIFHIFSYLVIFSIALQDHPDLYKFPACNAAQQNVAAGRTSCGIMDEQEYGASLVSQSRQFFQPTIKTIDSLKNTFPSLSSILFSSFSRKHLNSSTCLLQGTPGCLQNASYGRQ